MLYLFSFVLRFQQVFKPFLLNIFLQTLAVHLTQTQELPWVDGLRSMQNPPHPSGAIVLAAVAVSILHHM